MARGLGLALPPRAASRPCSRQPLLPLALTAAGEPSAWMVVPVAVGLVALLVLGLHPPGELTGLLARAVPS